MAATMTLGTIPTDSGLTLDKVNDALRASPAWQDFMRRKGQLGGRVKLSDADRRELETVLATAGVPMPKGMNIDPAGNINESNQGVFQNKWVQAGLIAAAAAATMGAAGFGPLAGLLSSGGGAATGGTAAAATAAGTTAAGGAGTAATMAGVAAAPSLARTALGYGLNYGVPIAANLIGARMASNADRDAAAIQNQYLNRALDAEIEDRNYNRGERANYLGRLQPYGDTGKEALGRASALLTTSSYRPELQGAGGAMVRLRAPDGSESEVPESAAGHYMARGAQRI